MDPGPNHHHDGQHQQVHQERAEKRKDHEHDDPHQCEHPLHEEGFQVRFPEIRFFEPQLRTLGRRESSSWPAQKRGHLNQEWA